MKRKIMAALGALALLLALGTVGGMECELISMGRGAAETLALMGAGAFLLWRAGVLQI